MNGLLSAQIWVPFLAAAALFAMAKSKPDVIRSVALAATTVSLALSLFLLSKFHAGDFHFQFTERIPWIPAIGARYELGTDGIALWMVVLTSLMSMVAVLMSRYVSRHLHTYMALILLLESFLHGAFLSIDLILFFSFFELTLFPLYFLITIWGGDGRKRAGAKFFIYTFAGSIFMLIGILAVGYRAPGGASFDLPALQAAAADGNLWRGNIALETTLFWAFAIGLLIKTPCFPFHTWIADTYAESPTVVPVLSSVMVKLGTFGILRFCLPLFPDVVASQAPVLEGLAVAGILYGAVLACVQTDYRRLIAYSSLSHMGFVLLGIFSLTYSGMVGGAFQQFTHGVVSGGLIVLLSFLWERRRTSDVRAYGGLKQQMPVFSALFLILLLASVGLPGTNGFIGEFLALLGSFEAGIHGINGLSMIYPAAAGLGVVLAAAYLLNLFQRLFYGPVSVEANRYLRDLKPWEIGVAGSLAAICILGGVAPTLFTRSLEASVQATRLMAVGEQGKRPVWFDASQRIDLNPNSQSRGSLLAGGGSVVQTGTVHYLFPAYDPTSFATKRKQ